jgi:hypothetical protein
MPYIKQEQRNGLDPRIESVIEAMWAIPEFNDSKAGILNYVITRLACGAIGEEVRYSKVNEVIGAMECAKLELYRRVAADYEDIKVEENGDAYPEVLVSLKELMDASPESR